MAILKNKVKYSPLVNTSTVTFTYHLTYRGPSFLCEIESSGLYVGKPYYHLKGSYCNGLSPYYVWWDDASSVWVATNSLGGGATRSVLDNGGGPYPTENGIYNWVVGTDTSSLGIDSSRLTSPCDTYSINNSSILYVDLSYTDCYGVVSNVGVSPGETIYICASETPGDPHLDIALLSECNGSNFEGEVIGVNNVSIGVNQHNYGGSPYTGWYRTSDLINNVAESGNNLVAMYKKMDSVMGSIDTSAGSCDLQYLNNLGYFTMDEQWTIEGWFRMNGLTSQSQFLFGPDGAGTAFPSLRIDNVGDIFIGYKNIEVGPIGYQFPEAQWVHIALTCVDDSMITLWVDGIETANVPILSDNKVAPITIGVFCIPGSTESFEGKISNFRIINGTAIYPVESVSGSTPYWNVNKSYNDTVLSLKGSHNYNYLVDSGKYNLPFYSQSDVTFSDTTLPPVKPTIDVTVTNVTDLQIKSLIQDGIISLINGHPRIFDMGGPFVDITSAVNALYEQPNISNAILISTEYPSIDEYENEFINRYTNLYDAGCLMSYPTAGDKIYNLKRKSYDLNGYGKIYGSNFAWSTHRNGYLQFARNSGGSYLRVPVYQTNNGFQYHFAGTNKGDIFEYDTYIGFSDMFIIVGIAGTNNVQFQIPGIGTVGNMSVDLNSGEYFIGFSFNGRTGRGVMFTSYDSTFINPGSTPFLGPYESNIVINRGSGLESSLSNIGLYVFGYVDNCDLDQTEMQIEYLKFCNTYNKRGYLG
jgi:hypothetical protein